MTVEHAFLLPLLLFLAFFEIYPLLTVFFKSFQDSSGQFTWQNYVNLATQAQYLHALRNSLLFATAAAGVGAVGGTFLPSSCSWGATVS